MAYLTRTIRNIAFTSLLLSICTSVSAEQTQQRELAAKAVSAEFMKTLGGALKKEMTANGPASAISVCRDIAPKIAATLSVENGWKVSRVSNKVRNPLLGIADDWEAKTLSEFESRAASGEPYADMTAATVVSEGERKYFRFMKAIAVQPVCLGCHGKDSDISAEVRARLDATYPFDQARGYKVGELRGAISIKQPMHIPLASRP